MARFILLDSGPLGLMVCRPGPPVVDRCHAWLAALVQGDTLAIVPPIADYEVRRELIRSGAAAKLRNLDQLVSQLDAYPTEPSSWRKAAEFWAILRAMGMPTADAKALDADCILAGIAATIGDEGHEVIIATTKLRHLSRFPGIDARQWETIAP